MRTSAQRIAAYNNRMQSTQIDPTLASVIIQQMENHTAHVLHFYPRQVALRDLLNNEGLTPTEFFKYEAYNGELYSLTRRAAGAAAIAEKEILVVKYTSLGCNDALLQSIALTVWEIPEPVTP